MYRTAVVDRLCQSRQHPGLFESKSPFEAPRVNLRESLKATPSTVDGRTMGVVALVYGASLLGLLVFGPWIDGLMGRVGEMRSEYTVYEQASKYVILLVILVPPGLLLGPDQSRR
jgi:hypothetical protein